MCVFIRTILSSTTQTLYVRGLYVKLTAINLEIRSCLSWLNRCLLTKSSAFNQKWLTIRALHIHLHRRPRAASFPQSQWEISSVYDTSSCRSDPAADLIQSPVQSPDSSQCMRFVAAADEASSRQSSRRIPVSVCDPSQRLTIRSSSRSDPVAGFQSVYAIRRSG